MTSKTQTQLEAIQEYMDAVSDYHEANLLVAEMRSRLVEAIEANKQAGLNNPDPLSAIVGMVETPTRDLVETVVARKVATSSNGKHRTRNSPRSSPGMTKKQVYEALPGDAAALASRTGLSKTQVYAAVADLVIGGMVERHGTRGNTTYVVKGDRVTWPAKRFAAIYAQKATN